MNEYRVAVPKGDITGYSQDPNQHTSNSGSPLLDNPITIKNAVGIGVTAIYGKKIASAGYKAVIGQLGNSRLERQIELGKKGLTYLGIGLASGPAAVYTVPLAIATDLVTNGISQAVDVHNNNLQNERTIAERGTITQFGAGGYYG